MGEATDDIVNGIVCMQCGEYLIDKQGNLNVGGFPCFCESCWQELPKKQKANGAPYFDEETGEIYT